MKDNTKEQSRPVSLHLSNKYCVDFPELLACVDCLVKAGCWESKTFGRVKGKVT